MTTPTRCPTCGKTYPANTPVCPACRVILLTPGARPRTPAWAIALLVALIIALAAYALHLAYQTLVLHRF